MSDKSQTHTSVFLLFLFTIFTTSTQASVFNTIGGVDYEWLELSATQGMNRDAVDVLLADPTSNLYGFRYATRSEASALFYSYFSNPITYGWTVGHAQEALNLLNDFGRLDFLDYTTQIDTVDAGPVIVDQRIESQFMFGETGECGNELFSCLSFWYVWTYQGDAAAVHLELGYNLIDASTPHSIANTVLNSSSGASFRGSLLVRNVSNVPVPSTAWLFGSGLLGLVGIARRRKATLQ